MPAMPKVYHIVHLDRLAAIVEEGVLLCDATISQRTQVGSVIGMQAIKERRLRHSLTSAEGVNVGDCVPFYFCPRSVMLYLIYRRNHPDLHYRGGQEEILHLEIDLLTAVKWANDHNRRWAITKSNAGAAYFEDFSDLQRIDELDWRAIRATDWSASAVKEAKQAEFLVETSVDWRSVEVVGVMNERVHSEVSRIIGETNQRPCVRVEQGWYC
ncbi:MAG: type II toxin-antitoxin system toxin DNA ADP-ribosyl transferase DarT [Ferrimicrobium sp.]